MALLECDDRYWTIEDRPVQQPLAPLPNDRSMLVDVEESDADEASPHIGMKVGIEDASKKGDG